VTFISGFARLLLATIMFSFVYLFWHTPKQLKMAVCDAQRMCPHCGRITPRTQAACLECGGALITCHPDRKHGW